VSDSSDEKLDDLVAGAELARARVATDVEQLVEQLAVPQLKARALNAAERSVETLRARLLQRLAETPRSLVQYVRQHPAAGVAIAAGASAIVWRLVARRRHD
jgi:ElaB/YqjD/DUF883 family membrane-anchored ribosome-binding protein